MPEKRIVVRRGTSRARFGISTYYFSSMVCGWFWLVKIAVLRWMVKGLKPGKRRTITLSYEEHDDA